MKAVLALKDGTVIHGIGFGAKTEMLGELVFNTSMMGYQEALTDPSYGGQILLMTYPLIGNYGTNKTDQESDKIHTSGFAIRERSEDFEHKDAQKNLDNFLKDHGVPGICGIDTRFIVRHIRDKGVMPAILATSENELDVKSLINKMQKFDYSAIDFVSKTSTKTKQIFGKNNKKKIALIDYGVKMGIVRQLVERDCQVLLLPSSSTAHDVEAIEPDGILLSNGPGDPAILTDAHKTIKALEGYCPIFGICLGHQLLAHAFGGDTYKLKFGHRGSNHAVMDVKTKRTYITTQNHGFAVDKIPDKFELTQINVNDKSVEGMRSDSKNIFSVQYHPEACPGPHDTRFLFDEFLKMI
ncbi:Anthranilate synthase component 2 [Candidatus Bilamarchaeum dharawalense]|uniref:Carbamoyl phosphate synthase small chain n=1 Tax=Candidatus Bilamarchaeum dharawalense TaxID=2885759 RepID=A0A5E4LRR1_9ARCH|nr:Anthranilate synthase component 2 [Candidatus Bilamarchaeum dharawalense]